MKMKMGRKSRNNLLYDCKNRLIENKILEKSLYKIKMFDYTKK